MPGRAGFDATVAAGRGVRSDSDAFNRPPRKNAPATTPTPNAPSTHPGKLRMAFILLAPTPFKERAVRVGEALRFFGAFSRSDQQSVRLRGQTTVAARSIHRRN